MNRILFCLLLILLLPKLLVLTSGCAQIVSPTGGKRDTIPPQLILSNPPIYQTNFSGNRITLTFNEYIVLDQLRENLLVSPTPKNEPYVNFKLKTVSIKIRDTLAPNTTYTIDLKNAVRDNNESNILRDFSYVFSTGSFIDSLQFSGQVQLAESGLTDSTLQVFLYDNLDDSAVNKLKPKYVARLDSAGKFAFKNLSPGVYNIFALKDGDGAKTYNSSTEVFAFLDSTITVNTNTAPKKLFAFAAEKEKPRVSKSSSPVEKKLKYSARVAPEEQDILKDLVIEFNKPLKNFDPGKIILTDTLFNRVTSASVSIDSTSKKIAVKNNWLPDSLYELIVLKEVGSDTTGLVLAESDTLRFKTKSESDYGSIKISFMKFNAARKPVLQFVKSNDVVQSYPLTTPDWKAPLFEPGEYDLRILFDTNNNGYWDPGNYHEKLQPEKVYSIPQKLNIRANWENERDIELPADY